MQANPSCVRALGDRLFAVRCSVTHQVSNTLRARRILRDVLRDGRVTDKELPWLHYAAALVGDEHTRNTRMAVDVRCAQDYLERAEDMIAESAK